MLETGCVLITVLLPYHNQVHSSYKLTCVVYMTAEKTSHQSGTDATSSGVQSPDRVPRAHSVAGRQPSYAQPTVASLLRMSRSNDLLDGAVAVPLCPRCRPRELGFSVCLSIVHLSHLLCQSIVGGSVTLIHFVLRCNILLLNSTCPYLHSLVHCVLAMVIAIVMEENGDFCVFVGPVIRTNGILMVS